MLTCEQMLDAVQSLPILEEIAINVFDAGNEHNNMTTIAHEISTKGKLNRLMIGRFRAELSIRYDPPGTWGITAALRSNTVISDLSIEVSWMKEEDCRLFSQVIKENRTLKSLHLFGCIERLTLTVAEVAGAVKDSKALVILDLARFSIDTSGAWALARSLSSAKKVGQLELDRLLHTGHHGAEQWAEIRIRNGRRLIQRGSLDNADPCPHAAQCEVVAEAQNSFICLYNGE
ncbi:hypothetical protein V5799_009753 [Amblyomma americanum]|uniref:Uncharacterized protein n=1 Tax=Amblyomma americanum TaxID=6943 RepID=A0AAQ4F9J7_AMBAM